MTYRDIVDGRTSISKVWRIDRRDSSSSLFGKTTDFTNSSIIDLILEGEKDAIISLNKMQVLFALEDLIADGIIPPKAGENAIQRIRTLVTAESFHKKTPEAILEDWLAREALSGFTHGADYSVISCKSSAGLRASTCNYDTTPERSPVFRIFATSATGRPTRNSTMTLAGSITACRLSGIGINSSILIAYRLNASRIASGVFL